MKIAVAFKTLPENLRRIRPSRLSAQAENEKRSVLLNPKVIPRTLDKSNSYFCAGVALSFWYAADSVFFFCAMGSRVG
jgi:hypothetical protein